MKANSTKPIGITNKSVWIGIGLGALFWILESGIHVFLFREGNLAQQILSPPPHAIWMRLIVVAMFIAFAVYTQLTVARRRRAEEAAKLAYAELNQIFSTAAEGMRVVEERTTELAKTTEQLERELTERKRAEEHIRTLTQELMKAQESERQRISRDLHDHLAQDLSSLKIGLDTLLDNHTEAPPEMGQRVNELSRMLRGTIMAVRDLAYDLRPASLDQLGLVQTIHEYCEDFYAKNGVKIDFFAGGIDDPKLDFDTKITLYRLIQEGLNNVRKHADASQVTIRLIGSFPNIILRIEDNGKGFDVEDRLVSAANERRMGLRSMEERLRLLQGKMMIESRPMEGTRIFIEFPYKEQKRGSKEKHIDR